MFILVKRNCLSAHGKIFRRGEVVELDDKVGESLLASEDYAEVMPPEGAAEKPAKEPVRNKEKSTKGKSAAGKKTESEDALPAPDVEGTVEG